MNLAALNTDASVEEGRQIESKVRTVHGTDQLFCSFQDIACQRITNQLSDTTKQSNNKRLFCESMSSCFAKVFSLHLGNDLYLKEKEEYPVLCEDLFSLIPSH